jgi:hypothetical protein
MDGSSLSLILIPIVVVIGLATWLVLVGYAVGHPTWKHGPASAQGARTTPAPEAQLSLPRTKVARPVRRPAGARGPWPLPGTQAAP